MNMMTVKGLSKRYKDLIAVEDISFNLEQDRIYGLIGRNGAGKTTLMRMLTSQLEASSGEIRIFGEHPRENSRVLSQICFIKESQQYPDHYKVRDALDVGALLFPQWDRGYALELLRDFDLPEKRQVKKLSRGMLSSLGIIIGLASRAPLTMFDEPYLGLDAVAREIFYDRLLEDYQLNPRTFIISTHLIDEISRILEHILLIDKGRLVLDTETDELRGTAYTVTGPASAVETFLQGRSVMSREHIGGYIKASVRETLNSQAQRQSVELGLDLSSVSLQQLIVYMTGKRQNDREREEKML
ncbi:ABC transporter ATP-binding protein [Paenibacillus sp. HN-1]|uniref:ABC transporter ATP-binding protein n=1 Tax=Paenibacillus TaxID=44249 RepID=UPI001CA9965C|nr:MULTISPECIES: ABC transporter ATP-binding protein [Paenibacillus]MBY9079231.1 ABC transporter ATP-binding protein [Paenibacillus sp. CGMCC 1.18879]MBY9086954.1 ABC transporter ATP-binding protein [Paenibacillus sinensis]